MRWGQSGSTLVAQYYGAKDYRMVERMVNKSFLLSIILGLALPIAGVLSSDQLLRSISQYLLS
jgi:Na+-driven multidrug efflux pump